MKPVVLVVEDEPSLQKLLAYNLEAAGFAVVQAFDGEEAQTLIDERAPDLAGDDLRAALREHERQHIRRVLDQCDDKREAARRLGLGLSSLYRKLEELGLRAS